MSYFAQVGSDVSYQAVTISSGSSLTSAIDLGSARLARIVIPSSWDAANLTLQVSYDGTSYSNLYDSFGTEYTIQAAASRSIVLPISDFMSIRFLKIRSGTSTTAVSQTADRSLILVTI